MVSHQTNQHRALNQITELEKLQASLQRTPAGINRGSYMQSRNALEISDYNSEGYVENRRLYLVMSKNAQRLVAEHLARGVLRQANVNLMRYKTGGIAI